MPHLSGYVRLIACVGLVAGLPVLGAAVSAPQSGQVAILFNPTLEPDALARKASQAGARLVRFGGAPGLMVVDLPVSGTQSLREAGAWLILDPIILGGCSPTPTPPVEEIA